MFAHSLFRPSHPSPSPEHILFLWNTFEDRFITSILHKPTARKIVLCGQHDRITHALASAIYFAAIVTLSPEECLAHLQQDKATAVSRYRFAFEQVLGLADFLNTQSVMLLQASVIFLFAVHAYDDTRFVWSMVPMLVRIGQGLGLHRDGANFGLDPFEMEMRRRLWWHLCILDIRSSEHQGTAFLVHGGMHDVRPPLNVNDDDIFPGMQQAPQERSGATDMSLIRALCDVALCGYEISKAPVCRGLTGDVDVNDENANAALENSKKSMRELGQRIQERYVRYWDLEKPADRVSVAIIRIVLAKIWLSIHHPISHSMSRASCLPFFNASRNSLLHISVEVIGLIVSIFNDEKTRKWAWSIHPSAHYASIAFTLAELCVRELCPFTERAWTMVTMALDELAGSGRQRKRGMWQPIWRLVDRAAAHRQRAKDDPQLAAAPCLHGAEPPHDPSFDLPVSLRGAGPSTVKSMIKDQVDQYGGQPKIPVNGTVRASSNGHDALSGMFTFTDSAMTCFDPDTPPGLEEVVNVFNETMTAVNAADAPALDYGWTAYGDRNMFGMDVDLFAPSG